METHFFIVMTFGAFVSKGGVGWKAVGRVRPPFLLRLDLFKQQTPSEGREEPVGRAGQGMWVFLDLCSITSPPMGGGPSQFGAHGERELQSVCRLANPPAPREGLPFCVS